MRSGQRPVLARNDPLDVVGDQRKQTVFVATSDRGEEVLYGLTFFSVLIASAPCFTDRIAFDPIAGFVSLSDDGVFISQT